MANNKPVRLPADYCKNRSDFPLQNNEIDKSVRRRSVFGHSGNGTSQMVSGNGSLRPLADCGTTKIDDVYCIRSADNRSAAYYYDPKNTPSELTSSCIHESCNGHAGIDTIHQRKDSPTDVEDTDSSDLLSRPTISMNAIEETMDPLNKGFINLDAMVPERVSNDHIKATRNANISKLSPDRQLNCFSGIVAKQKSLKPVWNFVRAITSDAIMNNSEDWGIDRSIYTRYSRSGFFADCHSADSLHHGEYLNQSNMELFAECRMPLIFCIIMATKEVRTNEIQRGIAPLAVNLLDRYMHKNKDCLSRIVSIAYSQIHGRLSDESFAPGTQYTSFGERIKNDNFLNYGEIYETHIKRDVGNIADSGEYVKCWEKLNVGTLANESCLHNDPGSPALRFGPCSVYRDLCTFEREGTRSDIFGSLAESTGVDSNRSSELFLIFDVIYNFVAAACYFIADRYNGTSNTSVKTLLLQWGAACRLFTKTRSSAIYIAENKSIALSIIRSLMFDIYATLNYRVTVPFPSYMIQTLIIASNDLPYSQNPSKKTIYQALGSILARVSFVDDSFHRFHTSIITLSIYNLIRQLAKHDKVISNNKTWLVVDESDVRISECSSLLCKTLLQFVDTEILDVLTQPININNKTEDLFKCMCEEVDGIGIEKIRDISKILSTLITGENMGKNTTKKLKN